MKRVVILSETVDELAGEAGSSDCLDIHFNQLPQHGCQLASHLSKREASGWLEVEKDGSEDYGHSHVELVVREDAFGVLLGLQG